MIRLKENKGITLIALVITIIVMLILVGVTVSVALNGGLFSKAKIAAEGTQLEIDREALFSAVIGAMKNDAEVDFSKLDNNLPEGFTGSNGTYTSAKENKFKVKVDGTIISIIARNSTELERYIFGEEGYGRDISEIFNMDFENDPSFTDDSLNVEYVIFLAREVYPTGEALCDFYINYEEKTYKFQFTIGYDEEEGTAICISDPTEEIKLVYNPEEGTKVGKYVQYDDKKWIVLYDDSTNGLQMISADIVEEDFYLGNSDETIEAAINANKVKDIDGNGTISDLEKSIYSYNHAIETLNNKCASLINDKSKIATDSQGNYLIRCVGSNPSNPSSENTTPYKSKDLESWNPLYNGVGYSTDYNFETDFDRMVALGINIAVDEYGYGQDYWMASRVVELYSDYMVFCVRRMGSDGYCYANALFLVGSDGRAVSDDYSYDGLRPVVSLETGVLDGLSGEGTKTSPLVLE